MIFRSKRGPFTVLCVGAFASALAWSVCFVGSLPASSRVKVPPEWYRATDPLVVSDLVVEGTISSVSEVETFSQQQWNGEEGKHTYNLFKVIISVRYVLKGERLILATDIDAIGFWASEPWLTESVNGKRVPMMGEGDRVVVCLHSQPGFLGGRFVLGTPRGFFKWRNAKWTQQDQPNRELFSGQLYRITDAARIEAVVKQSKLVVAGAIKSIEEEEGEIDGVATPVNRITIKVTGLMKGSAGREVNFIRPAAKFYPEWDYRSALGLSVGDTWVFMLAEDGGELHLVMGVNGAYRRKGEYLMSTSGLLLRYTTVDLVDIARQQRGSH